MPRKNLQQLSKRNPLEANILNKLNSSLKWLGNIGFTSTDISSLLHKDCKEVSQVLNSLYSKGLLVKEEVSTPDGSDFIYFSSTDNSLGISIFVSRLQ